MMCIHRAPRRTFIPFLPDERRRPSCANSPLAQQYEAAPTHILAIIVCLFIWAQEKEIVQINNSSLRWIG